MWRLDCEHGIIRSPWPGEFNRQAVDIISDFYFAPTERTWKNMLDEGKDNRKIYVTGKYGHRCPEDYYRLRKMLEHSS